MRGVAQMIEDDRYCIDVLNQVQAIQAALGRAESEILKRHAACCVAEKPNELGGDGNRQQNEQGGDTRCHVLTEQCPLKNYRHFDFFFGTK